MSDKNNLKNAISEHFRKVREMKFNDSELNIYADNILNLFELLMKADQKTMKINKTITNHKQT